MRTTLGAAQEDKRVEGEDICAEVAQGGDAGEAALREDSEGVARRDVDAE